MVVVQGREMVVVQGEHLLRVILTASLLCYCYF